MTTPSPETVETAGQVRAQCGADDDRTEPSPDEEDGEGSEDQGSGAERRVQVAGPGRSGVEDIDRHHHEEQVQCPDDEELGADQAHKQQCGRVVSKKPAVDPLVPGVLISPRAGAVRTERLGGAGPGTPPQAISAAATA